MVDSSGFDGMRIPPGEVPDPRTLGEQAEQRAADLARLRERLADLVGRATSDDGLVTVAATETELRDLHLDPKAMRKPSTDLADDIVATVAAARADHDRQRADLMAELGIATPQVDLDAMMTRMREMGEAFSRGSGDIQSIVERFMRQTGGR